MGGEEKNVVLFVVEGPSDETALALIFDRLFAEVSVHFDAVHSDLTTMALYNEALKDKSALDLLHDFVEEHMQKASTRYKWSDLSRVIWLVDTDGAFIGDACVIQRNVQKIEYSEKTITCKNAERIRKRNHHKAVELKKAKGREALKFKERKDDLPLDVYYMSRNLEHVLHGEIADLGDDEKEELAHEFQSLYMDDLSGFKALLCSNEIAAPGDDKAATWAFIESGTHSLERWSNLHLALPEKNEAPEEN